MHVAEFSFGFFKAPVLLVMMGGLMGALMLPLLGLSALYFRYRRCDARLTPSRLWDISLWISFLGLVVAGAFAFYKTWDKFIVPLLNRG